MDRRRPFLGSDRGGVAPGGEHADSADPEELLFPILVALVSVVASIAVLGLSWLAFFPIMIAALLSVGYAGIVHYLALELAIRPILFDINSALDRPVRIDRPVVPLRIKLLGSLPLINVITGVVVAALTSDGGGTDALGINVLIALFVSFTVSFELTVLLSRSILRPSRGPGGGDRADPPGALRRARPGHHLG